MVQHEADLLHKAAAMCLRMDQTYLSAQKASLPEPDKAAVIHLALNNSLSAGEVLSQLICRYFKTL